MFIWNWLFKRNTQIIMERDDAAAFMADICRRLLGHSWPKEVSLLLGTAAVESRLQVRFQSGGGPARGLWQMEPDTAIDIFTNYLRYRKYLYGRLRKIAPALLTRRYSIPSSIEHKITYDDRLACALARIHYLRVPEPVPEAIEGQAAYWKEHYNTYLGAGTEGKYLIAWGECGCDRLMLALNRVPLLHPVPPRPRQRSAELPAPKDNERNPFLTDGGKLKQELSSKTTPRNRR